MPDMPEWPDVPDVARNTHLAGPNSPDTAQIAVFPGFRVKTVAAPRPFGHVPGSPCRLTMVISLL